MCEDGQSYKKDDQNETLTQSEIRNSIKRPVRHDAWIISIFAKMSKLAFWSNGVCYWLTNTALSQFQSSLALTTPRKKWFLCARDSQVSVQMAQYRRHFRCKTELGCLSAGLLPSPALQRGKVCEDETIFQQMELDEHESPKYTSCHEVPVY